ncbi:MAG: tetratricopeptide repeat protein, partial [Candidatus Riflebacteria bacterium]|nr:tetratricopeptide repeat protein [Candidatus Riflebacteria bacterium]
EKSIEVYKEIINKSQQIQDKNNAVQQLADVLYSIHRYREGIELLENWMKNNKDSYKEDETACKLAKFYLQTGNKDEAWLLLERYLEKGSQNAFNALLDLAMKSGESDKLLSSLESHRTRFKSSVYANHVADCYLALGRKDKAIEAIKENKFYDKDIALLRKLSDIQISDKKIDDAIESLDKLVTLIPTDNQAIRKLGHCYFLKGYKEKAVEIWKQPIKRRYGGNQESYMNFTAILIEHQLLDQALEAFEEARTKLRQDTLFAEEKAAVLEALGRNKEAMEEYLKVLKEGIYKSEIFDKLYNANIDNFSLEKSLIAMNKDNYNQAIKQALIELYFRKANIKDIDKLVNLVDDESAIFFDDLFYDRLRQEALLVPEDFHFTLIKKVMDSRKESSLELKLAALILKMPEYCEKWQIDSYDYAKQAAESDVIADSDLKFELYLKMAEFAFKYMKSPKEADKYLGLLLKQKLIRPSKKLIIEAQLMRAMLNTYMSDFSKSEEILNNIGSILEKADREGGLSRLEQEEFLMQQKVEKARLKSHIGQYQEALDSLK